MKPRILLDTDIGGDCDDAGALALLNILALRGEAELLSVTSTTSNPWAPACIKVINQYYGLGNIPVGALSEPGFLDGPEGNVYAEKTARHFGYTDLSWPVEDAVRLMRRTLVETREKARIIGIGPLRNLSQLLNSSPDEISPLSGMDLIREKVESVSIMGGVMNEPTTGCESITKEYNIYADVISAQNFIHRCPVPITFIDFYLGENVKTGGKLTAVGDMNHPVTYAYTTHGSKVRSSWDPITVLYAVRGLCDCWESSENGTVSVTDDGCTVFTPNSQGQHVYLQSKLSPDMVAARIDELLEFRP